MGQQLFVLSDDNRMVIRYVGPTDVQHVSIPPGVTSIGEGAFSGCSMLSTIFIPNGVECIGDRAFSGCTALTSISIPDSVTRVGKEAFDGCVPPLIDTDTLPGVILVDGWVVGNDHFPPANLVLSNIRGIANSAFANCEEITSVVFSGGENTVNVGKDAFKECSRVRIVSIGSYIDWEDISNLPRNAEYSGSDGFSTENGILFDRDRTTLLLFPSCKSGHFEIPDGVTHVGDYAFSDCTGLTSVSIPDSVLSIGRSAFSGCSSLQTDTSTLPGMTLVDGWIIGHNDKHPEPDSLVLTNIRGVAASALAECTKLTNIEISPGATRVWSRAFEGCSHLKFLTIPTSVTSIGSRAFKGCIALTSISIPDSVTRIEEGAFEDCKAPLIDTVSLPGVLIVDGWAVGHGDALSNNLILTGIRGIADMAFRNCSRLQAVAIDDGLKYIGESSFSDCSKLTSIAIPDSVTSIGKNSFSFCCSLSSVAIPKNLNRIEDWTFVCCHRLNSIKIPDGVTGIGVGAFQMCFGMVSLTIPASVKEIGTSAFWGCFGLTSLTIPADRMGALAIGPFPNLSTVTIVGDEMEADWSAIVRLPRLISITIQSNVTTVNFSSLADSRGVKSIALDSNIDMERIFGLPFADEYHVGDRCTVYSSENGVLFNKDKTELLLCPRTKSGEYAIPTGVKLICDRAFKDCERLTSVGIPNSVTKIGKEAFSGCKGLASVTISSGVKRISDFAFRNCCSLTDVAIPRSVREIGASAFSGCPWTLPHRNRGWVCKLLTACFVPLLLLLWGVLLPSTKKYIALEEKYGSPKEQTVLGIKLLDGKPWGWNKNEKAAVALFEKAAGKGDYLAMVYLRDCYLHGIGVRKDETIANAWSQKADMQLRLDAEKGETTAMYILGLRYLRGIGVDRDINEAEQWFNKASAQGDPDSKKILRLLTGR